MLTNLKLNKTLWAVTTCLSLIAAVYGLINNDIYKGLMSDKFVAAQFGQDVLTILVAVFMIYLTATTNEKSIKRPVIMLGILGALAYLYGIFSIERVYNEMYLFYLAILSTSFFSIVTTMSSFKSEVMSQVEVAKTVRNTTAVFSILIGILFTILWISALLPLMKSHEQIDSLYSIYLLDLVFIMPAFFITAYMTFKKNPLGYILTPAMFILGIFVIFPLGLGEIMQPYFDLPADYKSMMMSFVLSGFFVAGAVWQLWKMK